MFQSIFTIELSSPVKQFPFLQDSLRCFSNSVHFQKFTRHTESPDAQNLIKGIKTSCPGRRMKALLMGDTHIDVV